MPAMAAEPPAQSLNFTSLNPSQNPTILLLHGASSSHEQWTSITPNLSSYHLLLPDLPSHGTSTSSTIPLTLTSASTLLATLIADHAHDGKVYLVGFSFGGYVALTLALNHPDLVHDVFLSGCHHDFSSSRINNFLVGVGLSVDMSFSRYTPKPLYLAVRNAIGPPITEEGYAVIKGCKLSGGQVAYEMGRWEAGSWERIKSRTLLVVGEREPRPEKAGTRGAALRRGNGQSRAVMVQGAWHNWGDQMPEVFATGVKAWFERRVLPKEFVVFEEDEGKT